MTDVPSAGAPAAATELDPKPARAVAVRQHADPTVIDPMDLFKIALQKGAGVEALKELNALQERVTLFRARQAFEIAVADARAELPVIVKNRTVGYESKRADARDGKVNYAHEDLAQIAQQIDPILSKHGLSYRFKSKQTEARVTIICVLSHRDGHVEQAAELSAPNDLSGNKNPAQAVASAATLLSRYTLKLSLGLSAAEVDDDGRASGVAPSEKVEVPSAGAGGGRTTNGSAGPGGPPRLLEPGKMKVAEYAQHYILHVKTANTGDELDLWDRLNDAPLQWVFDNSKKIYDEVLAASDHHRAVLARKAKPDPISTGRQPQQAQAPAPGTSADARKHWGAPDPVTDYEGFLDWAGMKLRDWTQGAEELEEFWHQIIEPASLLKPDYDEMAGELRKAQQKLEP